MKISDLTPAEYNPRIITEKRMDMLGKAMAVFGDLSGIIYNRSTGRLIGGHQRIKILDPTWKITTQETSDETGTVAVGHIETPAGRWLYREVEWDEQKEKLANIASNKHGGEFDWVKLKDLIVEIDDGAFDLELTGFTESELADVFGMAVEPKAGLTDDDAIPEAPEVPRAQTGDLYLLGKHRLLCGDPRNPAHVARLMDDDEPVLMLTDLYDATDGDARDVFSNYHGTAMYIYHEGEHTTDISDAIEASGMGIVSQIIWVREATTNKQGEYLKQHRPCWYAIRSGSTHNWQGARDQATTWGVPSIAGHEDQTPVECMAKPLRNNTRTGEAIYDPYARAGATMIACEKYQRRNYSMEQDPRQCDVIIKRWEDFTGATAILITETNKT